MRVDLTKIQVGAVVAMLRDWAGEDDRLLHDTLEGETDLFEIVSRLLNEIEADEGVKLALAEQINDRTLRKGRADMRIKGHREAICALLECASLDKLQLPEATLSVRKVPPKAIVTDEAAVPDEFCKVTREPDLTAIKAGVEAGAVIDGVSFDNGGTSLTIRRK
jgi:hypothetical protein